MGTLVVDGGTYSTVKSALQEITSNHVPITEDWIIDVQQDTNEGGSLLEIKILVQ